jgi:hypothetical protein
MNKMPLFSFLLCLLLTSCAEKAPQYASFTQAQQALKAVNIALYQPENIKNKALIDEQLPFSEAYLAKRHSIYQQLMQMQLTAQQSEQINYLVIAERFPERYFAWPAHTNVLANLLTLSNTPAEYLKVRNWLQWVQRQLVNAEQSNLKLNKVELSLLTSYVQNAMNNSDTPNTLLAQLNSINDYLLAYTPRGSIGLYGLANGSAWYQSKLNYYSGQVHSPLQWLSIINERLKTQPLHPLEAVLTVPTEQSLVLQYAKKVQPIPGLDWRTQYQDLPAMADKVTLSHFEKSLLLALMETDVGVHIHAWTLPQARINLIKRLQISDTMANDLVTNIVLYPAQSFSFYSQLAN